MPDPVTGTIVAVGGAIAYGESQKDKKEAVKAEAEKDEAEQALTEQMQSRVDDWNTVYGATEANLADYYGSLSADYYTAAGLEDFETEYNNAIARLREGYAQRGIDPSSGLATSLETRAELMRAEKRAEIRREAPHQVAEKQQSFLQMGLQVDPERDQTQVLSSLAGIRAQEAEAARIRADESEQDFFDTITMGISSLTGLSGGNE